MRFQEVALRIGVAFAGALASNYVFNVLTSLHSYLFEEHGPGSTPWRAFAFTKNPFWSWDVNLVLAYTPVFLVAATMTSVFLPRAKIWWPSIVSATFLSLAFLVSASSWPKTSLSLYLAFFFIVRLFVTFVVATLLCRYLITLASNAEPPSVNPASSRKRGFTLIEVLVVVAIIAILAALLFPVFARAKRSANVTSDTSQLRQVYLAIKLYEEAEGEMPPNLTYLVPTYAPKEILHGVGDPRPRRTSDGTYPAIVSCIASSDGFTECPRSPYMVSYPYLKTFEKRFNAGITFAELKARPEMGLLASLHHADLKSALPCGYARGDDPSSGKCFDSGIFLRTRMDGSTKALSVKRMDPGYGGTSYDCSWEGCFLY